MTVECNKRIMNQAINSYQTWCHYALMKNLPLAGAKAEESAFMEKF